GFLGPNVAFAPVTLGFALAAATALQFVFPVSADMYLAVIIQFGAMYLVICLLGNLLSIFSPMPVAPGTLRPVSPRPLQILLQVLFALLFPFVLAPMLIPLGVQTLLRSLGHMQSVPVCLLLTLVDAAAIGLLYYFGLKWEGELLQTREQMILEVVT